jgi:hypothetical protein
LPGAPAPPGAQNTGKTSQPRTSTHHGVGRPQLSLVRTDTQDPGSRGQQDQSGHAVSHTQTERVSAQLCRRRTRRSRPGRKAPARRDLAGHEHASDRRWEATSQAKASATTRAIPVIAQPAHAMLGNGANALEDFSYHQRCHPKTHGKVARTLLPATQRTHRCAYPKQLGTPNRQTKLPCGRRHSIIERKLC